MDVDRQTDKIEVEKENEEKRDREKKKKWIYQVSYYAQTDVSMTILFYRIMLFYLSIYGERKKKGGREKKSTTVSSTREHLRASGI